MHADAHIRVVLEVFAAIEQRDAARFQAHTHPGVTICWPPSQPTAAERQMDPEVIAAADDRVVVQWRQRGRSPTGLCFDGQVLGLYEIRGERLARAQMFYFDTDVVRRFLADAEGQQPGSRLSGQATPHPGGW